VVSFREADSRLVLAGGPGCQLHENAVAVRSGNEYSYSNAGINTAGRIIEVVSGQPFAQFLQERILDPLGMTDTTFYPTKDQIARLALSYNYNSTTNALEALNIGQLKYPLDDPARQPMPAGGLFRRRAMSPPSARCCFVEV